MNGCYHYLLLLSLLSSLEPTTSINLPNVTIQHVCEHDILFIKCSNLNETIQIVRSMYGRTSQRICNNDLTNQVFYKTCANIEQSKHQTKLRCNGKSSCQLLIDNHIFTDPCGSTIPKHFEIHYRCINTNQICFELFHNCSKSNDMKCLETISEDYSCQCPSTICEYNHKNQIIGFIENTCSSEHFQGIHWPKTLANKGQHMPCPYPCTGQIFRFCQINSQWSKPNYTNCQCPIQSNDRSAHNYVFQCSFWLINRLFPEDSQCRFGTDDNNDGSSTCLLNAFEKMSFTSCSSFSVDFQNLGLEIFIPMNNQSRFRLPMKNFDSINQIIVDRTEIMKENSHANLPMMFIDTKSSSSATKSLILVEQAIHLSSIQTANVTVIFNHRSSELRYQCRAYRSTNSSFQLDSTDMFFACQLLCSNGSHIICQCPFYNPFMHYVLHLDTSIPQDDFELLMIDNDLQEKCSIDSQNKSIERSVTKIDYYLKEFSSFDRKKNLAKKLLSFIDTLIDNEYEWLNKSFYSKWNLATRLIQQIEFIGLNLIDIPNAFISINNHLEFFVNSQVFENNDRSVLISIDQNDNSSYQSIVFIISKFDEYLNRNQSFNQINSHIVHLNIKQKNVQIIFRHLNVLNDSNQISTCVYLKNIENNTNMQWRTDGCYLLSSNLTHSMCSCNHVSTFAVLLDFYQNAEKPITKVNTYRISFISKIGCIVSIVCLLLTIITLFIMRHHVNIDDDLMMFRNILHINMSICLLIAQLLFLFGIDQTKYKVECRTISILLHYFLLATFSWMFVDGIELIVALKHVFKIDRIRILAYSLYAYGFPLLILILSISLSTDGNYSTKNCWLSYDNAFTWTFAIPFVLLILANLCFFVVSIYTICKHINTPNQKQEIRFSLRDITTLAILFGLTWLIGLFFLHEQSTIIVSYAFTILNSFQGLLIFIFYCLLQKQTQHFYIHWFCKICKNTTNQIPKQEKSNQHYNTSSSGYSSAHSSDLNKQILSLDFPHEGNQSSSRTNTEYLPSMPIALLTNRLTTFRYPTSNITLPVTPEHDELLLKRYKIDLHHQQDDHQYYEIG